MKKFAKLFMIVACMAMVFCFTAGVSATETDENDVTVTIDFQYVDRTETPIVGYPITDNSITVTASLTDTLYDVINAANIGATWDTVPIVEWSDEAGDYVPTGGYAKALTSLTLDGALYENEGYYPDAHTYTGTNWMWFMGAASTMTESSMQYPDKYLSQVTVAELAEKGYRFTLSYETELMSF